jgi:uncharacterized coiled-coil protein SlyX
MHFYTGSNSSSLGTERITLTSAGRVGIATASPAYALEVYGTDTGNTFLAAQAIGNSAGSLYFNAGSANGYGFFVQSVGKLYLNNGALSPWTNNNISCGSSGARFSVVYAVSGTINTSDAREKSNITPSNLGLNFISNLCPVSYTWKVGQNTVDDEGNMTSRPGKRTFYGFLAQDVKKTIDALGTGDFAGWTLNDPQDPDSLQGLRYTEFIAPMVKSIQELSTTVKVQQSKIDALEQSLATVTANFSSLEARLAALEAKLTAPSA